MLIEDGAQLLKNDFSLKMKNLKRQLRQSLVELGYPKAPNSVIQSLTRQCVITTGWPIVQPQSNSLRERGDT